MSVSRTVKTEIEHGNKTEKKPFFANSDEFDFSNDLQKAMKGRSNYFGTSIPKSQENALRRVLQFTADVTYGKKTTKESWDALAEIFADEARKL